MKMSPTIGALAEALSKAQGEMSAAEKDAENPFYKSNYSTFASVVEALRIPFRNNKLSYSQPTRIEQDGSVTVETILMHASGEYLIGELTAKPVKSDPQGIGSLVSYTKRYSLQAMAGVASADDDDGNAASGKGAASPAPPKPKAKSELPPQSKPPKNATAIQPLPGHSAEHFPFPGKDGAEEIYTAMPHQREILRAEAKRQGITSNPDLQHLSMTCIKAGVWVQDLQAAVKEWIEDGKKKPEVRYDPQDAQPQ